jgi:hypothetical protein
MKDLIFFLATTLAYSYTTAANKSKNTNYLSVVDAANRPPALQAVQTQSGDLMYVGECKENDVTYGVISIWLKNAYTNLKDAEQVLTTFVQNLQPGFGIQYTTRNQEYTGRESASAFMDYWQDIEQKDWKVKSWTNGQNISVLYVKNIGNAPVAKEERFLNSLRFIAA